MPWHSYNLNNALAFFKIRPPHKTTGLDEGNVGICYEMVVTAVTKTQDYSSSFGFDFAVKSIFAIVEGPHSHHHRIPDAYVGRMLIPSELLGMRSFSEWS